MVGGFHLEDAIAVMNLLLAALAAGLNFYYAARFKEYWRWTKVYGGMVYSLVFLLYIQLVFDGYPAAIWLRTGMTLVLINGALGAWTRLMDRRIQARR